MTQMLVRAVYAVQLADIVNRHLSEGWRLVPGSIQYLRSDAHDSHGRPVIDTTAYALIERD